jgi:hypothetical protein
MEKTNEKPITAEEFEDYEDCRNDGLTNMLITSNVQALTGLPKDRIRKIISEYEELRKKFG